MDERIEAVLEHGDLLLLRRGEFSIATCNVCHGFAMDLPAERVRGGRP